MSTNKPANTTKKMNKEWVEKQKDLGKTAKSNYIGGFFILLLVIAILVFGFLFS